MKRQNSITAPVRFVIPVLDMFCADNKNRVFWCYACGKHGNMDDFKILMGQEKPEMPQELDDENCRPFMGGSHLYFRYLMEHRDSRKHSDISRKQRKLPESTLSAFGTRLRPGGKRDAVSISVGTLSEQRIYASGLVKQWGTDSRMTCFATASCFRF